MSIIAFFLSFLSLFSFASSDLVGVVILSRHGVRTPYPPVGGDWSTQTFSLYSNRQFPLNFADWGATAPAMLTDHGANVIRNMGQWFGSDSRYSSLLSSGDCNKLYFYSDNTTRDILTAQNFLQGLLPNCANGQVLINANHSDVLFNQGGVKSPNCNFSTQAQMASPIGGGRYPYPFFDFYSRDVSKVSTLLQSCCDPSLCNGNSNCTLNNIPVEWTGFSFEAFSGPVSTSAYFGSFFLLEALNNMTIAWNEATMRDVVDLYQMEVNDFEIVDNWWGARSFGSTLGAYIAASLYQMTTTQHISGVIHSPDARFVYMAGHDVNLYFIRSLLNVQWLSLGWGKNNVPPGAMLAFELHLINGKYFVRIFFESASPDQIRQAATFSAGSTTSRVPIAIPGCAEGDDLNCELSQFIQMLFSTINPNCLNCLQLKKYVMSVIDQTNNDNSNESENQKSIGLMWGFIGAGAGFFVGIVIMAITRRIKNKSSTRYQQALLNDNIHKP